MICLSSTWIRAAPISRSSSPVTRVLAWVEGVSMAGWDSRIAVSRARSTGSGAPGRENGSFQLVAVGLVMMSSPWISCGYWQASQFESIETERGGAAVRVRVACFCGDRIEVAALVAGAFLDMGGTQRAQVVGGFQAAHPGQFVQVVEITARRVWPCTGSATAPDRSISVGARRPRPSSAGPVQMRWCTTA